ncbi:MAG: enoyl-CoA hydratase-related protein [Acidobacteria bacterium]|nr:enoyl-CoA hydratase-related protein [Acidobacteriota bacterium]
MTYSTIKLEAENSLGILTLNRPAKRNAISPEMIADLLNAFAEVEHSPAQVMILTGEGSAFCAGMDLQALKDFRPQSHDETVADARRIASLFRSLYAFPKPTIAAVNGAALAGGCALATLCDFTLTVPEAKFGYTEVRVGFIPAIVASYVVRQVGEKLTRDLVLTGRIFDAVEAYSLGLVNEVVPPDILLARARELGAQLAAMSPVALQHAKRLLLQFSQDQIDREIEMAIEASARVRATADFREGLAAFLEKRKPQWRGE